MSTAVQDIEEIQAILARRFPDVKVDGDIGKKTLAAITELDELGDIESAGDPTPDINGGNIVKASFFAGPQDIRAFRRCKAQGNSDQFCFRSGDNGVGKWGQDCTLTTRKSAALPREVWRRAGKTGGAPLWVEYKGQREEGFLDDTMPALANIHNGMGLDLNPGFAVAFGIAPEEMNNHSLPHIEWGWL